MRKILTLIFLITLSSSVFGQVNNETELTGKWKVEKILEKPTNPQFKPLIDGFEKATFYFKSNKDFELTTTNNSELFNMMMTEVLNGTKWKFVKEKQLVKIGNQEDGFTAMGILVKKENEKLYFHLNESGLTFLMKKNE
ncbi:hypothetical protein [Zobellia russellii]|uniref:hypothetical protein n=1 Tax=Zobellia russellii TaxID=248907 RepID=UPI0037DBF453